MRKTRKIFVYVQIYLLYIYIYKCMYIYLYIKISKPRTNSTRKQSLWQPSERRVEDFWSLCSELMRGIIFFLFLFF